MSTRTRLFRSRLIALAALMTVIGLGVADASDRDDHDSVWRDRQAGKILSLEAILQSLPPASRRQIVEIEFEYDDDAPIYEIEYIDDRGRLIEIEIDARSGVILKQEVD